MANAFIQCSVVTPEKKVLDVQAFDVVLPAHDGLMGVLPGQAPMLCNLGTGLLRYLDSDNNKQALFVDGGFGHVHKNEVIILTREAIKPDQISLAEAEKALEQAQALSKGADRTRAISRAQQLIAMAQGA